MIQIIADLIARPDQITNAYITAIAARAEEALASGTREELDDLNTGVASVIAALRGIAPKDVRDSIRDAGDVHDPLVMAFRLGELNMATGVLGKALSRRADDDADEIMRDNIGILWVLGQSRGMTLDAIAETFEMSNSDAYVRLYKLQQKGAIDLRSNGAEAEFFVTPMARAAVAAAKTGRKNLTPTE